MNYSTTQPSIGSKQNILVAIVAVTFLIPLFPIPGPPMLTGHPWKVELVWAIGVFLFAVLGLKQLEENSTFGFSFDRPHFAILVPLLFFTFWSGISVFWASSAFSVGHHTGSWFVFTVVYLAALIFFLETKSVTFVYNVLGAVSIALFVICVVDYVAVPDFNMLLGTIRIRYAKYGEMLAMAAPFLCSAAFLARSRSKQAAALSTSAFAWLTVMLSLSKGAFLAGTVGFAVLFGGMALFGGRRTRRTVLILAILWIAVTVATQFATTKFTSAPSTVQFISGQAEQNRETSHFRTFVWNVGLQMFRDHPVLGVGADNFGSSFNDSRRDSLAGNPLSQNGSMADDILPERAHNEPLQILSELGITGFFLLASAGLIFIIAFLRVVRNRKRISPMFIGSVAGLSAFAVSSMVSSFSFRAMQNGIVFFLILAAGMYEIGKSLPKNKTGREFIPYIKWPAALTAVSAILFFTAVGLSNFYTMFAGAERDPALSAGYFETSLRLNPENGASYFLAGSRAYLENRPGVAVKDLRQALKYGAGATMTYYYLAKSHEKNNEPNLAAETMREAIGIYPQSVYARVHYSIYLGKLGRLEESRAHLRAAKSINGRQAETWKYVLEDGLLNATFKTLNNRGVDKPFELEPANLISVIHNEERLNKRTR